MTPDDCLRARTDYLEQAQNELTRLLGSYHLDWIALDSDYTWRLTHANLGNLNLGYLLWQSAFQLEQKQSQSRYVIYLVLEGSISLKIFQQQTVYCSPEIAAIINPGQDLVALASEQGQSLLLCIERYLIEQVLANSLGWPLKQPLVFMPNLDLTHQLGRDLKQFLQFLWQVGEGETAPSPLVIEGLEQAFLGCLVKGLPHNYSEALLYQRMGALACYVQKAQAFMEANLQADIHLEDIATAVGVSPRMLEKAFAQHCDCSPMQFLKQRRLEQVRQVLERPLLQTKVTEVMNRYGFYHGGKFAKEYRERFGEVPSVTLKRGQQVKGCNQNLDD